MNLFDMIAKSYSEVRSKLELPIQGTAAHDAAAVGNPVQVGGVYRATDPAVADGDAVSLRLNAKGEAIVSVAGSNIELLAEQTVTWNGVKTNDVVEVPVTNKSGIMLSIDNSDTASALTVTFEHEVATDDWRQWYDGAGGAVSFIVPASTAGVYGPFQTFPRYLTGRIKFTAAAAPTNAKVTKMQVQGVV